jgi:hypothetical protein
VFIIISHFIVFMVYIDCRMWNEFIWRAWAAIVIRTWVLSLVVIGPHLKLNF